MVHTIYQHDINKICTLKTSIRRNSTDHKLSRLCIAESNLQQEMTVAKTKYISNIMNTHHRDSKVMYKYLSIVSSSNLLPQSITYLNSTYTSPVDKAHVFNLYFNSIYTPSSFNLPPIDSLPTPSSQLNSLDLSSSEVYEVLSNLDPLKTPGPDNISSFILKNFAQTRLPQLTDIFNFSLSSSIIPDQ